MKTHVLGLIAMFLGAIVVGEALPWHYNEAGFWLIKAPLCFGLGWAIGSIAFSKPKGNTNANHR